MTVDDAIQVTVICVTYNHAPYIAQALDGFVSQRTNFRFQVFVGEDHSPDNTADIVRDYAARYPDIIVPFFRERNMGSRPNFFDLLSRVNTPFVAFCDGDDYWTDPLKLQFQFDYMQEHPELRACFHNVRIQADEDWYLNGYYQPDENGDRLIPGSLPNFRNRERTFTASQYIAKSPGHFSSMFIRWRYEFALPDWMHNTIIADTMMMVIMLGEAKAGFVPRVMSVYRRSEVGITMYRNRLEHTLYLSEGWVYSLSHLEEFFQEHYPDVALHTLRSRLSRETFNYMKAAQTLNDPQRVIDFIQKYPDAFWRLLRYLRRRNDLLGQAERNNKVVLTDNLLQLIGRVERRKLSPLVKELVRNRRFLAVTKVHYRCIRRIRGFRRRLSNYRKAARYWLNTLAPKERNRWVFTSFGAKGYLDNTMYLYEYVLANHPEIDAVWLTLDDAVVERLQGEGKPVARMDSKEGRVALRRAAVAFSDHFRMRDYPAAYGFNNRTRLVNLWHGVGLKTMAGFKLTTVPGVRFSNDILPQPGDGLRRRVGKALRYLTRSPQRELFERYLFMVVPGDGAKNEWRDCYRLREEQMFTCGYPRVAAMLAHARDEAPDPAAPQVLYAPTYRWSPAQESDMIDQLLASFPAIEERMAARNGTFVVRLHPHTWRDYSSRILTALGQYAHIRVDREPDVYANLHRYSVMISDYSSITYDYLQLDRPLVFFCYDYEEFIQTENSLKYDYMEYSPGQKAWDWNQAMDEVERYLDDPGRDADWRHRVWAFFFDAEARDTDSPRRIVGETKKRIGLCR